MRSHPIICREVVIYHIHFIIIVEEHFGWCQKDIQVGLFNQWLSVTKRIDFKTRTQQRSIKALDRGLQVKPREHWLQHTK